MWGSEVQVLLGPRKAPAAYSADRGFFEGGAVHEEGSSRGLRTARPGHRRSQAPGEQGRAGPVGRSHRHAPQELNTRPAVVRLSTGALAQLVAHLLCKQGVAGSSPAGSTRETAGQLAVSFISVVLWFGSRSGPRGTVGGKPWPERRADHACDSVGTTRDLIDQLVSFNHSISGRRARPSPWLL